MPFLDVSDVLTDPDFCDITLQCQRASLNTSAQGLGQLSQQSLIRFAGVVTNDRGQLLERQAVGEHVSDTIFIATRFALRNAGPNNAADIVVWGGRSYTVTKVNSYATYGVGFTEVICELLPLSG